MSAREERQSAAPQGDLAGFPARAVAEAQEFYRTHAVSNGAWYFSSHAPGEEPAGRFDLTDPHGTCYLAESAEGAALEGVGPHFARVGVITPGMVAGRVVSTLRLPRPIRCADTTSPATMGWHLVGSELSVSMSYAEASAWAAALHGAGFEGLWYAPRFSAPRGRAVAVFAEKGERKGWVSDPSPRSLQEVLDDAGYDVVGPPTSVDAYRRATLPPGV